MMRPRRIYVPLSHDQLRTLALERSLPAPVDGYAAAAPGRVDARISPAASQEEAEYLAFEAASTEAAARSDGAQLVVVSADAPSGTLEEPAVSEPGSAIAIVTTADLPLRAIASLHVGEAPSSEGGAGDDVGDLLWYDVTELDAVVAELGL